MKPVILHCINSLALGGGEVLLRDTVKGLSQFEHVICYLHPPDTLAADLREYRLIDLEHHGWKDALKTVRKLKKIIGEIEPVIVHAHFFESTLLARFACPKSVKFFFTIHNILSKDAFEVNRLSLYAEKLSYKKNQVAIAVSHAALNDYDQHIGVKGPAYVVYNYVHEKFFNLTHDYSRDISNSFRLIAVGNLRRQKNYGTLLKAMNLLKHKPVSLDIFGGGDLEQELQNEISSNGLQVKLMGRVPEISSVINNYDAYIMPSLFEGFGIAPMEAMAAGLPVLLSDLPVFREIAGDLPLFFNPSDAQSIADAIITAMNNWEERKANAKRSKAVISEKASRTVYFEKLVNIYNKHLNTRIEEPEVNL